MEALTRCDMCGKLVALSDIRKEQFIKDTVFLVWEHGSENCPNVGQVSSSREAWAERKAVAERSPTKRVLGYNPEAVGKLVKGFLIDLDAVDTVGDMEVYWYDDRRYRVG